MSFRLYTITTRSLPMLSHDMDVTTTMVVIWDGRLAQFVIHLDMTAIWRTATRRYYDTH